MTTQKSTERLTLTAQRRLMPGTRATQRLRGQGSIPGIVYGKATAPISIRVDHKILIKTLNTKAGEHALVDIEIEGDSPWRSPALVKAVQHDPVDGHILHVDFHTITLTEQIRLKVPVVLKGESIGVKQEGGILEQFLREVEVECLPTQIPSEVAVDVSNLQVGQTLHVSDLPALLSAKIITESTGVIASVQQPKEEKVEEVAAAVTEPEVIREKKEEPQAQTPGEETKAASPEVKKEK